MRIYFGSYLSQNLVGNAIPNGHDIRSCIYANFFQVDAVSSRHSLIQKIVRAVIVLLGLAIIGLAIVSFSKSQFESIVNCPRNILRSVLVLALIVLTGYMLVTSVSKYQSADEFAYTPLDQYTSAIPVYQRVTSDSILLSAILWLILLDAAFSIRLVLGISFLNKAFYSCIRAGLIFSQIGLVIVLPVLVYYEGRGTGGLITMPTYAHALGIVTRKISRKRSDTDQLIRSVALVVAIILSKLCVGAFAGKYFVSEAEVKRKYTTRVIPVKPVQIDDVGEKSKKDKTLRSSKRDSPPPDVSPTSSETPKPYSFLNGKFRFLWG